MKPYYEDARSGITLYHGDAEEVLADIGPFDLLVTDPPFFIPAQIGQSRKSWPRSLGNLAVMEGWGRLLLPSAAERVRPTGAAYVFCDSTSYPVFLSGLYGVFDRTHCLVWDKQVGGLGNGWRHSHELVLHGAWSTTVYADGFRRDVIPAKPLPSDQRGHPSEKPTSVIGALLSAHPKGVVLDPFAGGGGILCAAKAHGWRAVGIEIDGRYCESVVKRLAQETLFGVAREGGGAP